MFVELKFLRGCGKVRVAGTHDEACIHITMHVSRCRLGTSRTWWSILATEGSAWGSGRGDQLVLRFSTHVTTTHRLIEELTQRAAALQCYKIILDCGEHNVPFYEKCGLVKKEVQMVRYFDR